MKFLATILSIYIFTLNLVPCEDTGTFDNKVKTEISQDLGEHHHHQNADMCSPFCQCHCCHIHVIYFDIIDFAIPNIAISTEIFHFPNSLVKNFTASILQPPQV